MVTTKKTDFSWDLMPSSLMYTKISEKQECTWIVRLKELANRPSASFPKPKPCFPHLAYYSTLKMQAASSSKRCIFTISHSTTSQKTIILICLNAQVHITLLFKFWDHTWSRVKLSLGLITYHTGKWRYSSTHSNLCTIKEVHDQFHVPATSPHRETIPSTIEGGCMNPTASLDIWWTRMFCRCLEWKSDFLVVQPTAYSVCWLIFVCLFWKFCVIYTRQQQHCKSSVFTRYLSVYYKFKLQLLWNQMLCLLCKTQVLCKSKTQRDNDSKGFWWHHITHRITWFLNSYPVLVVPNRKLYFEISCFSLQLKRLWGICSIGYV